MRAIVADRPGGAEVLRLDEVPVPAPAPGQVLIHVAAASVNRPDLIQREGHYPPPPGESQILGLDAAGTIAAHGAAPGTAHGAIQSMGPTGSAEASESPDVGARVMALLPGGGYAEYAVAYAGHVMPIPDWMSFEQAACIPEAWITAFQNLFINADLADGETVLLHGGGGGVGSASILITKALAPRSTIIATASSGKLERIRALGAHHVIDYRAEDFAARVRELTDGKGADVILDHIGGPYLEANLKSLATGGRLALIGTLGGRKAEIDLGRMLVKRQRIIGSVLRSRSVEEKSAIITAFRDRVLPQLTREMLPPIDQVIPLAQAAQAHQRMESSEHLGKIVLRIGEPS